MFKSCKLFLFHALLYQECDSPTPNVNYNISELNNDSKFESVENSKDTLSPQQNGEDNECSICTCLNYFTAPEIMTNNNKVVCKVCTELHKIGNISFQMF